MYTCILLSSWLLVSNLIFAFFNLFLENSVIIYDVKPSEVSLENKEKIYDFARGKFFDFSRFFRAEKICLLKYWSYELLYIYLIHFSKHANN